MAMGVWAFVLAVLPLFVTWVVAIGLAVAVLLRPNDGWRRGRGLAIAALVISSVWIILGFGLVIAGMTLPDPEVDSAASSKNDGDREPDPDKTLSEDVRASELNVGDCLLKPPGDLALTAEVAQCSDPHRAEVYAVWEMGGGPNASIDKQVDLADEGCFKRFKPFIGHGYYSSNLDYTWMAPDDLAWANHERTAVCVVYDNADVTGTLRGSLR